MAKKQLHPYIKAAGFKDEDSFYKAFPDPDSYFQHMQTGGFIMPAIDPVQTPVFMQEHMANGGFSNRPGYHYNGHDMVKSNGSTYNAGTGTFFEYGGLRAGNEYPQYVDNPVPFPAKYGGLRAGNQYPQYIDNPVPFSIEYGGYADNDGDVDEMKKGGIHIKKANVGKFTAYKKRTGKTTEEALHSSDPHVRKMANFARNAAKWHHETGGYANPFHPIHEYMQDGGIKLPQNELDPNYDPGIASVQSSYDPTNTGVVSQIPQQSAAWRADMTDVQAQQNINYGAGSTEAYDPATGNTVAPPHQQKPNKAAYWANQGQNLLGAGIATASYFENQHKQKQDAMYQRSRGLSDNLPHAFNPGDHGDYTQNGKFRPNSIISQTPMYNTMQMGGNYKAGQTVELDEDEIKSLLAKGYKLSRV